MNLLRTSLILSLTFLSSFIYAQKFTDGGSYMNHLGSHYSELTNELWDYTRAVAHNKSARKIEKRRTTLISALAAAKTKVSRTASYKGDASLKTAAIQYLTIQYNVIKQDYEKIVNMEAIAEDSYDAMEAYLKAQEEAGEKLRAAGDSLGVAEEKFAEAHEVNLVKGEASKKSKKLAAASKVFDYYNDVYLIFFKSFKQEAYFLDALNKGDVSGMEQNKLMLAKTSREGLKKLSALGGYNKDLSLINACKEMLNFYIQEADKKAPTLIDYYLKKETFEAVQKAFESKSKSKRTQKDIDLFNKSASNMNNAVVALNNTNNELNKNRSKLINNWNNTAAKFTHSHVAKGK